MIADAAFHDSEVSAVVPHRPADVLQLERAADIGDPAGTRVRRRRLAKGSKLVAYHRDVPCSSPLCRKCQLALKGLLIPSSVRIEEELIASDRIRHLAELR